MKDAFGVEHEVFKAHHHHTLKRVFKEITLQTGSNGWDQTKRKSKKAKKR